MKLPEASLLSSLEARRIELSAFKIISQGVLMVRPHRGIKWLFCLFCLFGQVGWMVGQATQTPAPDSFCLNSGPSAQASASTVKDLNYCASDARAISGKEVPCGWSAVRRREHPEWPPHITRMSLAESCPARVKDLLVRSASVLTMVSSNNATITVLRVTALEDGAAGAVIRSRSSFDGTILLGRVLDAKTLQLMGQEIRKTW